MKVEDNFKPYSRNTTMENTPEPNSISKIKNEVTGSKLRYSKNDADDKSDPKDDNKKQTNHNFSLKILIAIIILCWGFSLYFAHHECDVNNELFTIDSIDEIKEFSRNTNTQIKLLNAEINQFENNYDTHQIQEVLNRISIKSIDLSKCLSDVTHTKKEIMTYDVIMSNLENNSNVLMNQGNPQLESDIQELESKLQQIESKKTQLRNSHSNKVDSITDLNHRIENNEAIKLTGELDTINNQIESLKNTIGGLDDQFMQLYTALQIATKAADATLEQKKQLNSDLLNIEDEIKDLDEISPEDYNLDYYKQQLTRVSAEEAHEYEVLVNDPEARSKAWVERRKELDVLEENKTVEISSIQELVDQSNKALVGARRRLKNYRATRRAHIASKQDLEHQKNSHEYTLSNSDINQLMQQLELAETEKQTLLDNLEALDKDLDSNNYEVKLNSLRNEYITNSQQLVKMYSELKRSMGSGGILEKIESLKHNLVRQENECRQMSAELQQYQQQYNVLIN